MLFFEVSTYYNMQLFLKPITTVIHDDKCLDRVLLRAGLNNSNVHLIKKIARHIR
jgi:hypothetical protein